MTQLLFTEIDSEYKEYKKTADSYPDSPIEQFVIMGTCYDELPDVISDSFAEDVLTSYNTLFNGKVMMDTATIKKIICSVYIASIDQEFK